MNSGKKILVTGNQGYIGTVLVKELISSGYDVVGLDIGYFAECNLAKLCGEFKQINKDIRKITGEDLAGINCIVHLAGLSNDPLGELDPSLTKEINYDSTIKLAQLAKEKGVERFVYASSQSMYGISNTEEELDEDESQKNPITAYAKTKWEAECEIIKLADDNFTVTCFRPSTVFGASPRLRCDIVFNNLVACAYTTGRIEIKSDGSPWRPVVHVQDVCSAFIAGLKASKEIVNGRSYNVGVKNGNYTVRDLAEAAQKAVKGSELIFTGEHGKDSRTYKVGFNRILTELGEHYKPKWTLEHGAEELVKYFDSVKLTENDFRGDKTTRLLRLKKLMKENMINKKLEFMRSK